MKKKDEEIETLDFEDNKPSLDDTVEMLDFEMDKKVSNEIDEMLDFLDVSTNDNKENNNSNIKMNVPMIFNNFIFFWHKKSPRLLS